MLVILRIYCGIDIGFCKFVNLPLQYLLGSWDFYGREFLVGEGVLIPRPDTVILLEKVLEMIHDIPSPRILELCGGSGCLAVSIALERPDAEVWCVEKSPEAFSWLQKNNDRLRGGVHLVLGDALDPLVVPGDFDCILSNPPYLTAKDMDELEPEVKAEPRMALFGEEDGLFFYREFSRLWKDRIRSGGSIAYEIGQGQEVDVAAFLAAEGLKSICQTCDYSGIIRVISAVAP